MTDPKRLAIVATADHFLDHPPAFTADVRELYRYCRELRACLELVVECIEQDDTVTLAAIALVNEAKCFQNRPPAGVRCTTTPDAALDSLALAEPPPPNPPPDPAPTIDEYPDTADKDHANDLRRRFQIYMAGRKRGQGPVYDGLWLEAFKLTEKNGKWSATRAARLLGASSHGGNWLLHGRFRKMLPHPKGGV